jgi:hypothetical protein
MRSGSRANLRRIGRLQRRLALLRARQGRRQEALATLATGAASASAGPAQRLRDMVVGAGQRALVGLVATGAAAIGRNGKGVAHEARL